MLKDKRGNVVHVGVHIAYAKREGNCAEMAIYEIVEINGNVAKAKRLDETQSRLSTLPSIATHGVVLAIPAGMVVA